MMKNDAEALPGERCRNGDRKFSGAARPSACFGPGRTDGGTKGSARRQRADLAFKGPGANQDEPEPETRNGTELVGMYSCWAADEDNDKFEELSDFYAHWSLRELRPQMPLPRDYAREGRSAFVRLFIGKDLSMVGSLRIDMKDPDTTFVIPLATFSYQGLVGKGQNWSTNLISDDQTLQFFRIGPTSSAKFSVTAKTTSALQVQAASTVLGVLRNLSTIALPGSALVGTLTQNSIQQTSQTLDSALSNIWGESKEESHASARQLSEWYPGARFIIQLTMPKFIKSKLPVSNTGEKIAEPVLSRWYELSLSCPRRSIFSSFAECGDRTADAAERVLAALSARISAPQVLNFKVSSGVSLQQYVGSHDWYSRFLRIGDDEAGNSPQAAIASDIPERTIALSVNEALRAGEPVAGVQTAADVAETEAAPLAAPAATPTPAAKAANENRATKRTDSDYAVMCSSIVNALYSIGLSRLDAQIGLWALVTGSSDFAGIQAKFQSNPQCRALLPLAGTKSAANWAFANK